MFDVHRTIVAFIIEHYHLVDLVRYNSKRSNLCDYLAQDVVWLRSAQVNSDVERRSVQFDSPPHVRQLGDRFTDDEVAELLDSYQQGTTFRELAEQFNISTTSVKKLLYVNKVPHRGHKFRRN